MVANRRTLTDQLIGRQVLLLAILVVVIALSQYIILRAVLISSEARTLHQEMVVLAPLIHRDLLHRTTPGFRSLANILSARLTASGINLIIADSTGQLVSTSSRLISPSPPPIVSGHYLLWHGHLVVSAGLGDFHYPDGRLWLLTRLTPMHDILMRDLYLVVALGALMLAVTALAGSFLMRRSLRPLETIRAGTTRIAGGDIGYTTTLADAPLELQEVSDAINSMSLSIKDLFDQEKLLAEQMRRFVADASHELRTPLTAINGFLSILRNTELSPEEESEGLATIQHESQRMARLVNQLLTLSRIDTAPATAIAPVPLNLQDWLNTVTPVLGSVADPHPITFSGHPIGVVADPDRLTEIVLNLVENAARYSPPESPIEIAVYAREGRAILEVGDYGPGIPPSDLNHLFERFYRSDEARTSTSGGTGLGLSIVDALVKAHDGYVEVSNREAPQHGAIFRVLLPLQPSLSQN